MKILKKTFRWIGIVLGAMLLLIITATMTRQNLTYDAPYPNIQSTKDSLVIAKGKHLVFAIAHCSDCHSKSNPDSLLKMGIEPTFSGGVAFNLPVGTIYSANITSDPEFGIGKYTDQEIGRVLRYGVHPDGTAVYDFMPFHNLSDEDLTAVISYLRTQKPVSVKKPKNELNAIGNIVKAFLVKPVGPTEKIVKTVKPDSTAAYGKYLVLNVGNCSGCHTRRRISGEAIGELLSGGNPMSHGLVPPNLTTDRSSRIFGWSEEIFISRFRSGKLNPDSEMPWESFKRMNDLELKAVYRYLRTLKPVKSVIPAR